MTEAQAKNIYIKYFGKKPDSIIELNPKYFLLISRDGLCYSINKQNGEMGCYDPLDDPDQFLKAIQNTYKD